MRRPRAAAAKRLSVYRGSAVTVPTTHWQVETDSVPWVCKKFRSACGGSGPEGVVVLLMKRDVLDEADGSAADVLTEVGLTRSLH